MIRTHDFNTEWWGRPVGIVDDPRFFDLPTAERERQLAPYAWVELKAPLASAPDLGRARRAGFVQEDVQIPFRLGLAGVEDSAALGFLTVRFADEHPFAVAAGAPATFHHERFFHLPGITADKVNERYLLWGRRLIENDPSACLEVYRGEELQGWFLSSRQGGKIDLTLAMRHRASVISGALLYQKALREYARRGARVGAASFSVTNTAVMNIYAELGARFLPPIGYWLWTAGA